MFWTASTKVQWRHPGVNDTSANLLKAIETSQHEISPSTLFAVPVILKDAPFINGAPQNTSVPGYITLVEG